MRTRNQVVVWLAVGLLAVGWILLAPTYEGNPMRHFAMEITGAAFALAMALIAFGCSVDRWEGFTPYVGAAFLAAGLADFLHAAFGIGILLLPAASLDRFIPGTWTAGRTALGLILLFGIIRTSRHPEHRPSGSALAGLVAVVIAATLILFALIPLPAFITGRLSAIYRPWELLGLVLYALSFWMIVRRDENVDRGVGRLLLPSLALGIAAQGFMVFSPELFDRSFDIAHISKDVSYLAALVPLAMYARSRARLSVQVASIRVLTTALILFIVVSVGALAGLAVDVDIERSRERSRAQMTLAGELALAASDLVRPVDVYLTTADPAAPADFERLWDTLQKQLQAPAFKAIPSQYAEPLTNGLERLHEAAQQYFALSDPVRSAEGLRLRKSIDAHYRDRVLPHIAGFHSHVLSEDTRLRAEERREMSLAMLAQVLVVLILLPVIFVWGAAQAGRQVRPLLQLTETARSIWGGERDVRAAATGEDEVGTLATTFNMMLDALRDSEAELQETLDGLEAQVADRTADLMRARDDLLRLIDTANAPIFGVDTEGNVSEWNQVVAQITGYSREEAMGRNLVETLIPEEYKQPVQQVIEATLRGEETANYQSPILTREGQTVQILLNSTTRRDDRGNIIGVVGVGQDITERVRTERELRRVRDDLRRLIDSANAPIFGVDTEGNVNEWNQVVAQITGYSPEEAIGRNLVETLIPEDYRDSVSGVVEATLRGEQSANYESPILTREGQTVQILLNSTARRDDQGNIIGVVGVGQDITQRVRAERELRDLNLTLEQQVAERSADLAGRARELARSNAELEQFAYVASHDLQEPLRMISSYTELLARRCKGKLDSDADDFVEFIEGGVSRMRALIRDLLAYSRVGTRGKPLEETDAEAALDAARRNLQAAIEETGAVITSDALPAVLADSTQLTQLLQNLVGNAIKFHGDEPPRVHVSAKQEGNEWVFAVSDNGIGIAPEYQERIFMVFQRLHGREEYPGTGVGLAICQKIVERHGGRIWVESEPGKGSTFYFTVPVRGG